MTAPLNVEELKRDPRMLAVKLDELARHRDDRPAEFMFLVGMAVAALMKANPPAPSSDLEDKKHNFRKALLGLVVEADRVAEALDGVKKIMSEHPDLTL